MLFRSTYNSVWIVSNSYLAFLSVSDNAVGGYPIYYPIDPGVIRVPFIAVGAGDRSLTAYYYGETGDGRFVVRYEGVETNSGGDPNHPSRNWEIWFYQNNPGKISVVIEGMYTTTAWPGGVWGIADDKKWIDIYDPLWRYDQHTDQHQNAIDITSKAANTVNNFKFIGSGVETYVEGNTAFVEINPLQGFLDLSLDWDTIVSSAHGGLQLLSSNKSPIKLFSSSYIDITAASGSESLPGSGEAITISGGNGYGPNTSGGNVFIEAGLKTGTGQDLGRNKNGTAKDDTSWFASFAPASNPQYVVIMVVSQGGFGATTSAVGVRDIYSEIFGVTGGKIDPTKSAFPNGIPDGLPKLDVKNATLDGTK